LPRGGLPRCVRRDAWTLTAGSVPLSRGGDSCWLEPSVS